MNRIGAAKPGHNAFRRALNVSYTRLVCIRNSPEDKILARRNALAIPQPLISNKFFIVWYHLSHPVLSIIQEYVTSCIVLNYGIIHISTRQKYKWTHVRYG